MVICPFDQAPPNSAIDHSAVLQELKGTWEVMKFDPYHQHSHVRVTLPDGRSDFASTLATALENLMPSLRKKDS
jgi:hypothetical protein